jgi:hypothetical protein
MNVKFIELHETKKRCRNNPTAKDYVDITETYFINVSAITSIRKHDNGCEVEFYGNAGYHTRRIDADESYETIKGLLENNGTK